MATEFETLAIIPPFSGQREPSEEAFGSCLSWKVQPIPLPSVVSLLSHSAQQLILYPDFCFYGEFFCVSKIDPLEGNF